MPGVVFNWFDEELWDACPVQPIKGLSVGLKYLTEEGYLHSQQVTILDVSWL